MVLLIKIEKHTPEAWDEVGSQRSLVTDEAIDARDLPVELVSVGDGYRVAKRPMSPVAERVGETDTRRWRMLFRQVDATYTHADLSNVFCVGVDELSVRKGHGLGRKPAGRYRGWTGVSPSFASLR